MTTKAETRQPGKEEKERIQAWLFSDSSEDSEKARELLGENEIRFKELLFEEDSTKSKEIAEVRVLNAYYPSKFPAIVSLQGDFEGLEEVERFIKVITQRPR